MIGALLYGLISLGLLVWALTAAGVCGSGALWLSGVLFVLFLVRWMNEREVAV